MTPFFISTLKVEETPSGLWKVVEDFSYHNKKDDIIVVPAGFLTDFASVPRIFWTLIPRYGKYTSASVLHDYLYSIKERSREESDRIFLDAMKVLKVSWWKRRVMWSAVRMFGGLCYDKNDHGQINIEPL